MLLTKRKKLVMLNKIKSAILEEKNSHVPSYLCVWFGLMSIKYEVSTDDIFNLNIAKSICEKLKLPQPNNSQSKHLGYWADYDYNTRIKIIEELIEQTNAE